MKACPKCHEIGNDADNFCRKCGYIYNQEKAAEKNMDLEYRKAVKWSKSYLRLLSIVLILLLLVTIPLFFTLVSSDPWFSIPIALLCLICLFGLISAIRLAHSHEKVRRYAPEKRYQFFRKATEQRLQGSKRKRLFFGILTIVALLYAVVTLIAKPNPSDLWGEVIFAVLLIFAFFGLSQNNQAKKLRVKYHQTIDDATYFELEELGLIKETDVIISLYKDFLSWKDVKADSKILILTQDSLICMVFSDRSHAQKVSASLSQIEELGIFTPVTKKSFNGMIITIGRQKQYLRIVLKGASIQDSPEEFVDRFLKQLDNAILSRPHDEVKTYQRSEATASENIEQIRQIEIADVPETPSPDKAVASATIRTIDL